MKSRISHLRLLAAVALSTSATLALAESTENAANGIPPRDGTVLQSEEEIWEYLEQLCIEAPTQRCETMEFILVRDGEVLPMRAYDERNAYRSKRELIEDAIDRMATQPETE